MHHKGPQSCFLLLFLFFPSCSSPPTVRAVEPGGVILAFGDSLTFGTGAAPNESYPAVLEALSGRRVVNAGVPGEASEEGMRRLPALLDQYRPQLLILCHGGNDLLRGRDIDRLRKNLEAMIREARSRDIAVFLVGVPMPGLFLKVPKLYEEVAEFHRLPYDGKIVSEIESSGDLKSDSIHPNAAGYRRMAEAVYGGLKSAGAFL